MTQTKLCLCLLVLAASQVSCGFTSDREALDFCAQRASLKSADISKATVRNDNCTVDCTTMQATLLSFHVLDGTKCREDSSSRCFMGLCLKPDEAEALDTRDLYSLDIYIKSAHVDDKDPAPGTGGSDALVALEVASEGYPSYADGQTICHTYIIQDNNQPRWNGGRGFLCRPMPVRKQARLRFIVLDSDKPLVEPDLLGVAAESVEGLMNKGSMRLKFDGQQDSANFLEVEVKANQYKLKPEK